MKRLLLSLCVAITLPAVAQTQPAKPAAKKALSPSAKPQEKVMTRDELRNCLRTDLLLRGENDAIREEGKKYDAEVQSIKEEQKALTVQNTALENATKILKAEQADLLESRKQFDEPVKPSDLKAVEARKAEFNDRVNAHERKREVHNTDISNYQISARRVNDMADQSNSRGRALVARQEKLDVSLAEWRTACSNKAYNIADEVAVKKELQATGQ